MQQQTNHACLNQIIDVDDDGHLDLAIAEATSTGVSIWRGRGDGTFEEPLLVDVGIVPEQFFLADLNGDDIPTYTNASRLAHSSFCHLVNSFVGQCS